MRWCEKAATKKEATKKEATKKEATKKEATKKEATSHGFRSQKLESRELDATTQGKLYTLLSSHGHGYFPHREDGGSEHNLPPSKILEFA
jgi:hypothetical protein